MVTTCVLHVWSSDLVVESVYNSTVQYRQTATLTHYHDGTSTVSFDGKHTVRHSYMYFKRYMNVLGS